MNGGTCCCYEGNSSRCPIHQNYIWDELQEPIYFRSSEKMIMLQALASLDAQNVVNSPAAKELYKYIKTGVRG